MGLNWDALNLIRIKKNMSGYTHIQNLMSHQLKIVDLFISGLKTSQIAAEANMTMAQIRNITNSPVFQAEVVRRRGQTEDLMNQASVREHVDQTRKALDNATLNAAETLISNLNSENEAIQIKSAAEILDRTSYPRQQKIEQGSSVKVVVLDPSHVKIIKETVELDRD